MKELKKHKVNLKLEHRVYGSRSYRRVSLEELSDGLDLAFALELIESDDEDVQLQQLITIGKIFEESMDYLITSYNLDYCDDTKLPGPIIENIKTSY